MKKQTLLIFLLFLIFNNSFTFAQKKRDDARENILMLKNGALFVRLKTASLKINALKEKGLTKEAEVLRINQEKDNTAIIEAFKTNFAFCPVYFFYSNYSAEITSGNFKGLLMNVNAKTDSTFNSSNYLIGEFDQSATTQLSAFFIKDKNYVPLRSPFPFLIKQNQGLTTARSNESIVSLLSKRLSEFYKQ
jgi:hypothetical protein